MTSTASQAQPQDTPETSAQAAAHRRIARAYDPRTKLAFFSMKSQRLRELMDFKRYQFGDTLPDDDWGRDCLQQILNQLALMGADPDTLRARGRDLLPEIDDDDSLDTMVKEIGTGRRIKAGPLGRAIGLTYQARVALDIRTIACFDVSPSEQEEIARLKRNADRRWNREKAGAKPHAKSAEQAKPWEAEGVSRSTHFARKKLVPKSVQPGPTEAVGLKWPDYDVVVCIEPTDSPAGAARVVPDVPPGVSASHQTETTRAASKVVPGKDAPSQATADTTRAESLKGAIRGEHVDRPVQNADTTDAVEIGDRATRRLGEMMKAQAKLVGKAKGSQGKGRPPKKGGGRSPPPKSANDPGTLAEAGIDKNLAHAADEGNVAPARHLAGPYGKLASHFDAAANRALTHDFSEANPTLTSDIDTAAANRAPAHDFTEAEHTARLLYLRRREAWDLKQRQKAAIVAARLRDGIEIGTGERIVLDRVERERQARFELSRRQQEARRITTAQSPALQKRHAGLLEAVRCGDLPASVLEGRAA